MTEKPCDTFAWIGQSFACCDDCGKPYWEHTHEYALGTDTPLGDPPQRNLITPDRAANVRMRWEGR